jgi:hypothetical protein
VSNQDQDPLFLPDEVKSYTKEGNLVLMTELTRQANDMKRKIQASSLEVEKWTKRVQLSRSQADPALLEDAEAELVRHKREMLQAQMDLSGFEDKRTELRFQHNAPSTEQKFKTAQAQAMVQQFQSIGIDTEAIKLEQDIKNIEAEQALAAFKEKSRANQPTHNINVQMTPTVSTPTPTGLQETTPGELRRGAPLGQELLIKGKTWRRVDAVNIGDKAIEEDHKLSCEGVLSRSKLDSLFPIGRKLADEGIEFEGALSMTIRNLTPEQDILVILRVDVAEKNEVETLADGALVQTRPLEVDTQNRWRHETVIIPGAQVMMDDMILSRRAKEKTKSNLYALWVFQ